MIPILYVGPPGVGKTAHVRAEFDHVEVLLASALTEEDIAGLPYRDEATERRTIPAWLTRLHDAHDAGKTTCLFLDELDKARREVADTLLTLVQSRCVGTSCLPAPTAIRAAANPPEWGGGDGISQPMQSRFAVIQYVPNVAKWCEWARSQFPRSHSIIARVECGEAPFMEAIGEGYAWRLTCPRTWALALQAHEAGRAELVQGLLTPAAVQAFAQADPLTTRVRRTNAARARTVPPVRL